MTLLTTEIHNHNQLDKALIVFAADRRISRGTGYDDTRRKVFEIPSLNAGIGYFGLAEVPIKCGTVPMEEWLTQFLSRISAADLRAFANGLASTLNSVIPVHIRQAYISGFHISGFNANGQPEFWFVRNVADDRQTIFGYYEAREDFQRRDAPRLKPGQYQIYRNGDILAHVVTWEAIDQSFGLLLQLPQFKSLTTPDEYKDWVKFKMEVIAQFYERYCMVSIIGGPVDAFLIRVHKPT